MYALLMVWRSRDIRQVTQQDPKVLVLLGQAGDAHTWPNRTRRLVRLTLACMSVQ